MRIANFNTDEKIFIIAEIGNNHEGNIDLAKRMIAAAADSGVDAVKFQTLRPEHLLQPKEKTRFETLQKFAFSFDQFRQLAQTASDAGVLFLSTPFDVEAARFLNDYVPAFKIASGDNNFYPLLETVSGFGKPVIMSTGLAELKQVAQAKKVIEDTWRSKQLPGELALLHCVTSYPTPAEEAGLSMIPLLRQQFGTCIGYSDHTVGTLAAISSVALGARIIEKHFTMDKNQSSFRDHQLSADPTDMKQLVEGVRELELMLRPSDYKIGASESANLIAARRSISVNKDLPAGHIINYYDLCWLRPGDGISPGQESLVIGKALSRDISKGSQLSESFLK